MRRPNYVLQWWPCVIIQSPGCGGWYRPIWYHVPSSSSSDQANIHTHTHLEMYKRDFRLINTHSQRSIWWWLVISGRLSAAAIIWCSSKTLRASRKINVSQSVVACLILSTHQLHSAVVLSPNRLINTLMMLLLLLLLKHYQSHQSYWYTTE